MILQRNQNLSVLPEVSRQPKGSEWLWHPKVVALYKVVLENGDISSTSREAAIGALQNITTGEAWVGAHDLHESYFQMNEVTAHAAVSVVLRAVV